MICLRSPVFRASILSDMQEGRKGEIFIRDIDEKTLGTIIHFIYTGELELSEDYDLEMLVYAADKYYLPGIMKLLCNKMRKEKIKAETIADLLICASRHDAKEMREVALSKIRADRGISKEEGFKKRMKNIDSSILIDLLNDL